VANLQPELPAADAAAFQRAQETIQLLQEYLEKEG
jgi:hypothetical protein